MKSLIIILAINFILLQAVKSQTQGDDNTNPIIANLCTSSTFNSTTSSFNNNSAYGDSAAVTLNGADIFYEINLPSTTPYDAQLLNAKLNGYYNASPGVHKIYFLWFEANPATNAPIEIDSIIITGIPSLHDTICSNHQIQNIQSQYYLVIDFKTNINYSYSLDLGFTNSQSITTNCIGGITPIMGTLVLDTLPCSTSSSPYQLATNKLLDTYYNNIFNTPNLNSSTLLTYDGAHIGYTITLKNVLNTQEYYTASNGTTYNYNQNSMYTVGITVFLKNETGSSGLKGFRINIPGSTMLSNAGTYPANNAIGTYNNNGQWLTDINPSTSTCTWYFSGVNNRGDINSLMPYGCKVYTFSVTVNNLQSTVNAYFLSDVFGNALQECFIDGPRSDCIKDCKNEAAWQPLGSGGTATFTGTSCSNNIINCDFGYNIDCCSTVYYNTPCSNSAFLWLVFPPDTSVIYTTINTSGCIETTNLNIDQYTALYENGLLDCSYSQSSWNGWAYITDEQICYGDTFFYPIITNTNYDVTSYLTYSSIAFDNYPWNPPTVNIDGTIIPNSQPPYNSYIPSYDSVIPITKEGYYTLAYPNIYGDGYIISSCLLHIKFYNGNLETTAPICNYSIDTVHLLSGSYFQISNPDWNIIDSTTAIVSPKPDSTYIVSIFNAAGCEDVDTISYTFIQCLPVANFIIPVDSICSGNCISIINSSTSAQNCQWYFQGIVNASYTGYDPPTLCYYDSGFFTITLIASNNLGADTMVKGIYISNCDFAHFNISDDTICASQSVTFEYTGATNYNNNWIINADSTYTLNNQYNSFNVSYSTPGVYNTILIVSNNIGADTITKSIVVENCNLQIALLDTICASECIDMQLLNPNINSMSWSLEGSEQLFSSELNPTNICWNIPGQYLITAIGTKGTFQDTIVQTLIVKDCFAKAIFSLSANDICADSCILINNNSINADTYQWIFEAGNPSFSNLINPGPICFNQVGNYTITQICKNQFNSDTLAVTINVVANPELNFSNSIYYTASGKSIQLNVQGSNNYNWSPSDFLNNEFINNPISTPVQDITYTVTGTNLLGCSFTDSVKVLLLNNPSLPNSFTPNGDGLNDLFRIINNKNVVECEINIYDRYGNIIFSSNDINFEWNGTFKGEQCEIGSYNYIFNYKLNNLLQKKINGAITLIR